MLNVVYDGTTVPVRFYSNNLEKIYKYKVIKIKKNTFFYQLYNLKKNPFLKSILYQVCSKKYLIWKFFSFKLLILLHV